MVNFALSSQDKPVTNTIQKWQLSQRTVKDLRRNLTEKECKHHISHLTEHMKTAYNTFNRTFQFIMTSIMPSCNSKKQQKII